MVVTALIGPDYHELHQSSRDPEILEKLRSILTQRHGKNLVHGDIRDTNITVQETSEDIMLIDFDWAGKIGEVRYPMNVFRGDGLWRSDGACDGELITTEHDTRRLVFLVGKLFYYFNNGPVLCRPWIRAT